MRYTKDLYKHYSTGDYTYGNPNIIGQRGGDLEIGKFCSIADDVIKKLLEIKWWNWNIEKNKNNAELLCGNNIVPFVKKHFIENKNDRSI